MADRGVRWLIQWVTDQASRKQVEDDGRATAGKVGADMGDAGKKSAGIFSRAWTGAINSLKTPIGTLAGTLGGLWSAAKVIQFGRASVLAAAESEAVWSRLDGTLRTVGTSLEHNRDQLEGMAAAFQKTTIFDDEAFAGVVQDLISITGDYGRSLRNVGLVADFAAARHLDLNTAALIVGKAMVGETGTLSRYGIVVKAGADALEVMRLKFAGMAEHEIHTFDGQLAQLTNEWGNFKEALGGALLRIGQGRDGVSSITTGVRDLTKFIESNQDAWVTWGAVLVAVFKTLALPVRMAFNLGQAIGEMFNLAGAGLALLADHALDLIPGIDRTKEIAEDTFFAQKAQNGLTDAFMDATGAIVGMGKAWKGVASAAAEARDEQQKARDAAPDGGARDPLAERLAEADTIGKRKFKPDKIRLPKLREDFNLHAKQLNQNDAMKEEMEKTAKLASSMADSMTNAWGKFFDSLDNGKDVFQSLGQAALGVGASVVAGLSEGMAQYHLAQAAGKLAEGTWPPNPLAIASALKHTAAAALFRGLGQIVGSAGGRGGGSGSASSGVDRDRVSSTMKPEPANFTFYIDTSDPHNPVWQERVKSAYDYAYERNGNANIEVFPMNRRTGDE